MTEREPGRCPSRAEIDASFEREDREANKRGWEFAVLFAAIVLGCLAAALM